MYSLKPAILLHHVNSCNKFFLVQAHRTGISQSPDIIVIIPSNNMSSTENHELLTLMTHHSKSISGSREKIGLKYRYLRKQENCISAYAQPAANLKSIEANETQQICDISSEEND